MTPSTCCFCNHSNPERAKFCNECASPLHLRPCGSCNAVNARTAETCHRCGTTLSKVAVATADAMPTRIVAQADATLATLKRELVGPAVANGGGASPATIDEHVVREAIAQPAPAAAAVDLPVSPAQTSSGDRADAEPTEHHFTTASADEVLDAPVAVRPGEREWRPERRSRGVAYAAVFALLVLPVAVYLMRNPAQIDAWLGRVGPTVVESTPNSADTTSMAPVPPPLPPAQLPASTPAAATAGAQPGDTANVAPPAQAEQAVRGTGSEATQQATQPASPDSTVVAPIAPPPEASGAAAAAPERPTKAASKSPSRTSANKARARERTTKGRSQPPPAAQRSGEPAEACTDAMVAVGLCSR